MPTCVRLWTRARDRARVCTRAICLSSSFASSRSASSSTVISTVSASRPALTAPVPAIAAHECGLCASVLAAHIQDLQLEKDILREELLGMELCIDRLKEQWIKPDDAAQLARRIAELEQYKRLHAEELSEDGKDGYIKFLLSELESRKDETHRISCVADKAFHAAQQILQLMDDLAEQVSLERSLREQAVRSRNLLSIVASQEKMQE